jgi:hypothetical protein
MDIVINERQEKLLESYVIPPEMRERLKKVNAEKQELEGYIEKHGEFMIDVTNGKTYLVQYLRALSELVGKEYAVCAPVKKDGTYGAFYVKPWETFKKNYSSPGYKSTVQQPIKKNLYQQMMASKKEDETFE